MEEVLKTSSSSAIIILHEIYGINEFINSVCEYFKRAGFEVICPNLLNLEEPFGYDLEHQAYEYFTKNIGFDKAAQQVEKAISEAKLKYKNVFLIGFSIGATIAWLCSNKEIICDGIIGFYGSRIRNYLYIAPKCKTLLIFANEEKSFDEKGIVSVLENVSNTKVYSLPGAHGFMDTFSKRYNYESFQIAFDLVERFLDL